MVQQLFRMVEGALTHRAELLVAASYYGSAVLGRLSSAARPGAVRARLRTPLSPAAAPPAAGFRAGPWHTPPALSAQPLPLQGSGSASHGHLSSGPQAFRQGRWGRQPHGHLFPFTASAWLGKWSVSQSSPSLLYQCTRVELAPARLLLSCPFFLPVEILIPSIGAKSKAQQ